MIKRLITLVFSILLTFTYAQEQKKDTIQIDEVIIEVTKSNTKLQKMPMAISHISAKSIERLGVNKMSDLNALVPNFFMPDYGSRLTSPIYIRGIGARLDEPSVGLYVDDIPYFEKGSFNFEFQNIKKIEVLRGPQGTLYGRNTMGGLIRVYTPDPEFKTEANIRMDYATNNYIKPSVHVNLPLSEKIAFLVDASITSTDGFFTNEFTGKKVDKSNTTSTRFKLRYDASENLTFKLLANYEKDHQDGYPYAVYNTETRALGNINYNKESAYDRDLYALGFNAKYKTKAFDLSFSTSYQGMEDIQLIDQDFLPTDVFYVDQNRAKRTFVEELNINSKKEKKIKWIVGLFAFQANSDKNVDVDLYNYNMTLFKTYDQPTNGLAAFGQVEIPVNKFKFTAGLRYDYEKTSLVYGYDRAVAGNLSDVSDLDLSLSYNELLPKLIVDYKLSNTANIYTSFSKGYKAGGFNSTIERDEDESYLPEYSLNYELGAKTQWFTRKLTANASLFYIDWEDQQTLQVVPSGRGVMTKNAGKSTSLGAELELAYKSNKALDFGVGFGYTKAKYTDYQYNDTTEYGDNYIPLVPNYTFNAVGNYHLYFNNAKIKQIVFNASYKHFGKSYWEDANENYQGNYGLLNANITANYDKLSFGVWTKNVLDTNYNSYFFTISSLNSSYAQQGTPAQFGVFAKYKI